MNKDENRKSTRRSIIEWAVKISAVIGAILTAIAGGFGMYKFFLQEEHRPQLVLQLESAHYPLSGDVDMIRVYVTVENVGKARAHLRSIQAECAVLGNDVVGQPSSEEEEKPSLREVIDGIREKSGIVEQPAVAELEAKIEEYYRGLQPQQVDPFPPSSKKSVQSLRDMISGEFQTGGENGLSFLAKNHSSKMRFDDGLNVQLGPGEAETYPFNVYLRDQEWELFEVAIGVSADALNELQSGEENVDHPPQDSTPDKPRIWFATTLIEKSKISP